jgi:hypothetical protein
MTKAELESKHLAELHSLAAETGVPRYRMLSRGELIERLASGKPQEKSAPKGEARRRQGGSRERARGRAERGAPRREPEPEKTGEAAAGPARPKRRRRRRRWGRRRRVRVHDLLLSALPGGRAIVYAETREGCTTLLREVAAELSGAKGPDPIALLVDPSPEELAAWKRDAPKAEIVAAGQARHAADAIAQATRRAKEGEAVIVLVDSLSRFAEAFGGAGDARELFESGGAVAATGNGSVTVVAAVERS